MFLVLLLLGFNYSCSKKIDSEETIKKCKDECSNINDPDFCKRICEKEILNPRWKFFTFDKEGSAWFYDLESISTSYDIVPVWLKTICSERVRQNKIKEIGKKAEKLDHFLWFCEIDCSKRRYRVLELIAYASNDSILEEKKNYSENTTIWEPILPDTRIEWLFKEICKK